MKVKSLFPLVGGPTDRNRYQEITFDSAKRTDHGAVAYIRKFHILSVMTLTWLVTRRSGRCDYCKSRPVRTYSCLAVFATKDSSPNGARRVSSVVTVVTLVSGFHRHAVLGELSSLSVLPSYDGWLWQRFDHAFHHHRHDLCFWPVPVASFVSSCRIVSVISLYFLQLLII